MKTLGIIGCGWLGKPLYKTLSLEHKVECFQRDTTQDNSPLWKSEIIIISINTKDNYLKTLAKICSLAPKAKIILMSSTSVYREFNDLVNEETSIVHKGLQKEAEVLVQNLHKNVLILRLGGLMGKERIAGKWKKVSTFSDGPVNYIHLDDVINIVKFFIDKNIYEGVYNCVSPEHPLRSEVHAKNCKKNNLPLGTFQGETLKIVDSTKLIKQGYTFTHPNPLNFWD